ncbi:MAG: hypothetical protein KGI37_04190 [Alphaproteobacteria bacterium]|nr:hypothetical protein [Alphaproteobacteria bacterium]
MLYEELHRRYGTHVSQRVKRELTASDFDAVAIDDLPEWLEARAEAAHDEYRQLLNNPISMASGDQSAAGAACRRWREAEDLAYLIAVAEDVGAAVRIS